MMEANASVNIESVTVHLNTQHMCYNSLGIASALHNEHDRLDAGHNQH